MQHPPKHIQADLCGHGLNSADSSLRILTFPQTEDVVFRSKSPASQSAPGAAKSHERLAALQKKFIDEHDGAQSAQECEEWLLSSDGIRLSLADWCSGANALFRLATGSAANRRRSHRAQVQHPGPLTDTFKYTHTSLQHLPPTNMSKSKLKLPTW